MPTAVVRDRTTLRSDQLSRHPLDPLAVSGAVLGAGAPLLALIGPSAVALSAMLLVVFAPGAAVVTRLPVREAVARWALSAAAGLSVWVLLSTLMLWSRWWHPRWLLVVGPVAALACARRLRAPASTEEPRLQAASPPPWWAELTGLRALAPACGAAGLLLWFAGVRTLDVASVGTFGLLASAPVIWFAGLGLGLSGFVAEVWSHRRLPVLLLTFGVVLVVCHATVPVLLHEPEYAWTYKHLGVVELIQTRGQLNDRFDIYQQWPGLFAAVAAFSDVSGVAASAFAEWLPLFHHVVWALLLLSLFRTLTSDPRAPWLALAVWEAVALWVGQDYLAPQALAFLMWLGIALVVLLWLRHPPEPGPSALPLRSLRERLATWLSRDAPLPPAARDRVAWPMAVALLLYAGIVVTHQLTPFLVLVMLLPLAAIGVMRPRLLLVAFAFLEAAYLIPRYPELVEIHGPLLSGGDPLSNGQGNTPTWYSRGQVLTAIAVRVLALTTWAAALAVAMSSWRRPGRVLLPAVLAFAPLGALVSQSYGGEAIYRVYLFSSPWCALLLAMALLRWRRRAAQLALVSMVLPLLLGLGLQGRFGQLFVNVQSRDEVQAARTFYRDAQPFSTLLLLNANWPTRLSAEYGRIRVERLPHDKRFLAALARPDRLERIENYGLERTARDAELYIVFTDGQFRSSLYFGEPPPDTMAGVAADLAASPRWQRLLSNDDVLIYQYVG